MTKYIIEEQSQKIEDWNKAGIHEADLMELAKKKFAEFSKRSASTPEQAQVAQPD
jgi:NAD(P)H-hydrate repair Nnr-like enzyme with NAD(P)H-hydrate epimerase domain